MKESTIGGIILGYILAFILTFGHAYHQIPDSEQREFAGQMYTVHNGLGAKAAGAFLASIFWPLYWSAKAWE
jgi:predicted negative regulator of RcsB-dependent stress response